MKKVDFTGRRIGNLTVISKEKYKGWLCRCDCGQYTHVISGILRFQNIEHMCPACRKRVPVPITPGDDITNQSFHDLIALHYIGPSSSEIWLCRCICGRAIPVRKHSLLSGTTQSCGTCTIPVRQKSVKGPESLVTTVYTAYLRGAINRGYIFELTKEQVQTLLEGSCYYCGYASSPSQLNGIDRVNNDLGYSPDNVRTCCRQCNVAKNTLTEQEFYAWLQRASIHLGMNNAEVAS